MLNATRRSRSLLYVGLVLMVVFSLLPYYWIVRTSVLTNFAAIDPSTGYLPISHLSLQPYFDIWNSFAMTTYFKNSIIVSLSATIISLLFSIPGAYAFARLEFPGRKFLFYTAVFTIMFPWIVITIPVYDIFYQLGLINSLTGIIIALSIFVLPQTIWLLQGFFRQGIPPHIEEAARIDGLSELGAFARIVLPLSMPAVAAAALFSFLNAWNNFLWVFVLTSDKDVRTATVAIHYILGSDSFRQWNLLMAAAVLLVLPPVVFYALSQRYVGEGLAG